MGVMSEICNPRGSLSYLKNVMFLIICKDLCLKHYVKFRTCVGVNLNAVYLICKIRVITSSNKKTRQNSCLL